MINNMTMWGPKYVHTISIYQMLLSKVNQRFDGFTIQTIEGLAQGLNSGSLALVGMELATFCLRILYFNH